MTAILLELLDEYGAALLESAVAEVLARDVLHVPAVRQLLEQRRHAQGRPSPTAVALSDPRLRDVAVRPHDLSTYDRINKDDDDDDRQDA